MTEAIAYKNPKDWDKGDYDGARALFMAILMQSLEDACTPHLPECHAARHWLLEQPTVALYADHAGLNADHVISMISRVEKNQWRPLGPLKKFLKMFGECPVATYRNALAA